MRTVLDLPQLGLTGVQVLPTRADLLLGLYELSVQLTSVSALGCQHDVTTVVRSRSRTCSLGHRESDMHHPAAQIFAQSTLHLPQNTACREVR